ncbi:DSPc-domain-containing protein [Basidiobolus meristosporus CBS 931.73]|uniref:protein-tyrosine-phosphatase n=1 Tax=Basidiobolus meristosporus CBS 931.73 TaxID=1314790 RepID=A0A1Y1YC00_9FUNG|nr:DSPc-domain-containing protein [Basidiobolus meristosporus CBS 931.73]|eukprot:ORX95463.1 DSPc-domain-containing protein [Basidiobolus meristosporus CBS 931.73]
MAIMLPQSISRPFSKASRNPLRVDIKKRHCKPPSLVIPLPSASSPLSALPLSAAPSKPITPLSVSPLFAHTVDSKEPASPLQEDTYQAGPVCILPNLYLGSEQNAQDKVKLEKANIHYILNVAQEVDSPFFSEEKPEAEAEPSLAPGSTPHTLKYKKVNWSHNQEKLSQDFSELFGFIDQARISGSGVLVHCQCGISRSASLVIAYIMRTLHFPLNQAYAFVKLRSPSISPNLTLVYQLIELEAALHLDGPSDFSDSCSSSSSTVSSPST